MVEAITPANAGSARPRLFRDGALNGVVFPDGFITAHPKHRAGRNRIARRAGNRQPVPLQHGYRPHHPRGGAMVRALGHARIRGVMEERAQVAAAAGGMGRWHAGGHDQWPKPRNLACHGRGSGAGAGPAPRRGVSSPGATDVGLWVTKFLRDLPVAVFIGHLDGLRAVTETADALHFGALVSYEDARAPLA